MHQGIAKLCLEAMKDTQDPSQLGSEDAMIHMNKILTTLCQVLMPDLYHFCVQGSKCCTVNHMICVFVGGRNRGTG